MQYNILLFCQLSKQNLKQLKRQSVKVQPVARASTKIHNQFLNNNGDN